MRAEHFTCTNCGRVTSEHEVHQLTPEGRCLSARLSWFRSDAGNYMPAVEKLGEYPPGPGAQPRAGGL